MSVRVPTNIRIDWKFLIALLLYVCGLITGYAFGVQP